MPIATPSAAAIRRVYATLVAHHGVPPAPGADGRDGLVAALVATILSQSTSDTSSQRAFADLVAAFPDWDGVRTAPPGSVAAAIRRGGLGGVKARRIQAALAAIHARYGATTLEPLRAAPASAFRAALTALPGVGPKTAACVLLFGAGRPDFPVDTHVHRVTARLGWVPPRATAAAAYGHLAPRVPPDIAGGLHLLLVRHGRTTCRARAPRCGGCPLGRECPSTRAPDGASGAAPTDR